MDLNLHVFAEELTQTIDEFDGQIAQFELDPKSAVSKSEAFVLKLRRIISNAFSGEKDTKSKPNENSVVLNPENEIEGGTTFRRKSPRMKRVSASNQHEEFPKFGRVVSKERQQEIEKTDQHLRSVETETAGGFYRLYKCLLCNQDFNNKSNARVHVHRTHFKLGFGCKSCNAYFFTGESHRRHISKCRKIMGKAIHVQSTFGGKNVKVHVYSQSKQSNSAGISRTSNKTVKSFHPKNSNLKARNPLKKATRKINPLKLDKREKTVEKRSKRKDTEEHKMNKKPKLAEKTKKRTKTASECQNTELEKSRVFDVEGAQLICGIERSFLV